MPSKQPASRQGIPTNTKILYLIDQLRAMGGAESVLLAMTQRLPAHGFACEVVTFDPEPARDLVERFECPVHLLPLHKTYYPHAAKAGARLIGMIRSGRFPIVQSFFPTSDLWGGLLVRLFTPAKLISSRRDMGHTIGSGHRKAYRLLSGLYDQVHAVSELVRQAAIEDLHWPPEKIFTVYNGLDVEALRRRSQDGLTRSSLGVEELAPVIVTVGNLRHIKGTDVLIGAARLVCDRYPRAVFLIAGHANETEYAERLQRLTVQLRLERNIRFLGPRSDVPALLGLSTVFALPSRNEGFSNALIEAMALGLPCVATAVGGNSEAIEDGVNGFLVPREDKQGLAARILQLLDDPAAAARIGQQARETVERRFNLEAMISNLAGLYGKLL